MATLDTLKTVFSDTLDIDPEKVTEDATLDALGIDSLDMTEVVCAIEDEFGIEFGEPDGIDTVGQLVGYIDGLNA